MKIAHLASWLFWRGAEQQVLYLAQFLQTQGYDSVVVGPARGVLYQRAGEAGVSVMALNMSCLLYTSPSPRDATLSRMPSSA